MAKDTMTWHPGGLMDSSKQSSRCSTKLALILCLLLAATVPGCSAKKAPPTSPAANLPSKPSPTVTATLSNAVPATCYDEVLDQSYPCDPLQTFMPSPAPAQQITKPGDCGTLKPICKGLTEQTLIPQDVDAVTLDNAFTIYWPSGIDPGCRFQQLPRCGT